ncbi:MAG: hypothetical protein V4592_14995 [Bacteroidota bacterium]
MKLIFLVVLTFVATVASSQQQPQNVFKITTFTEVPRDMEGCGENLFLNKQDEKAERFVFYTDYVRGLICVNNKMILITHNDKSHDKDGSVFSNKDYTLIIKYGQKKSTGNESYQIKSAIITLKYHSKVVWTKSIIGGGGC